MYSIVYNDAGDPILKLEHNGHSVMMSLNKNNIAILMTMLEAAKVNLERMEKDNGTDFRK